MATSLGSSRRRRVGSLVVALLVALVLPSAAVGRLPETPPGPTIDLQILDISDWHGQLDPTGGVGGAAVLSAYFAADRAKNPNTITLTAGDDFGASPPLASFFEERPAVLAERMMGIQVGTFGNHNFDRGIAHLQEMIDLAASTDPDVPGQPYRYVSANLAHRDENLSGVDDFAIFQFRGLRVAVIGITNEEAPTLVFPGSFGTIEVTDSVTAANRAREAARRQGASVFIVIAHKGITNFDAAGNPQGPLVDFAKAVSGFHAIIGDHTDVQWQGEINGQLVLENRSKGVTYSRTTLTVHRGTGRLVRWQHEFVSPVAAAVTPDPAILAMLSPFRTALAAAFDRKIGVATDVFVRGGNIERRQEVAIGNLIADGMRLRYGTQLALMNGGGIRAPLPSGYVPLDPSLDRSAPPPFDLVVGDAFTVLPFGNIIVTRTVTGAQLWAALENGVSRVAADGTAADGRFPQVSGFRFVYDSRDPVGSRVKSVTLADGTPILPDDTTYTLALPNFVNAGGDSYTMFADGQGVTRDLDAQVLLEYIESLGTITPTTEGRIVNLATAP